MNFKQNYLLFIFFFFLVLLYLDFSFIEFIFLTPLILYIYKTKKINWKLIVLGIGITSIINFMYFYGYGIKLFYYIFVLNLIYYGLIILLIKFIKDKKLNEVIFIPFGTFIIFYLFLYMPASNFWFNVVGFLNFNNQLISIIGTYPIFILIILVNVLFFKIFEKLKYKIKNSKLKKKEKVKVIQLFFSIVLLILIISIPIKFYNFNESNETLDIALIQGNLKQDWGERFENKEKNYEKYMKISLEALQEKPETKVIVWPEYTFTNTFEFDFELQNKIRDFVQRKNITLILGSIKLENLSSSNSKRYDTLYIFENNNIQIYNAYLPVTLFDSEAAFAKNNNKIIIQNKSIGLLLCYEENFNFIYSKQINENNAEAFLVVGNQYYINNYHGLYLSALNTNLRAIESNKEIARLETGGITKVISNKGETISEVSINSEQILFHELKLDNTKTFYSKYSKEIDLSIFIVSIIILIISFIFNLKNNKN